MKRQRKGEGEVIRRPKCLEHSTDCQGDVEYVYTGMERSYPRCEYHAERYLERRAEIQRRYGGVAPPPDFDPGYAGERWSDED